MKITVEITKRSLLKTILLILIVALPTYICAVNVGYQYGYKQGYVRALADVKDMLGQKGIVFEWQELGDGKYLLSVRFEAQVIAKAITEVHLTIEHWRNGVLLSRETGAGVLTQIGEDWIEQQLAGAVNASQKALYCADSNDATDPPLNTWTQLPSEITGNGLERQLGAYTSTGYGQWTVVKAKSVTGTQSTQLWGLQWKAYTDSPNNCLLAADSGPTQKNCVSGDTLTETWTVTVSGA